MPILNHRQLVDPTRWVVLVVGVVWTMGTASVVAAQQPTSQVLAFTGTMPGQPDGSVVLRLRLFNVSGGGSPLFEETETVMVVNQSFTVRIGDATAGGVPATLFHDNESLWIAFALDSSPDVEIGVRTAITSGGYAHAAQLLTTPIVRTLNGLSSDVALAAGTNITITPNGNTLTIDAAGSGLPSVSHDGTLLGNGTGGAPLGVAAPLHLTGNQSAATISGTNASGFGAGVAGNSPAGFGVNGLTNTGQGVAGTAGSGIGVYGTSDSGPGGVYGLHTASTGTGSGVLGRSFSTDAFAAGVTGEITSSTPGGYSAGVRGINNGTGGNGIGVYGSQNGSGWGVHGTANGGSGVFGSSTSGAGVTGNSVSGPGVTGSSASGPGIVASGGGPTGMALQIQNGAIKVVGAGSPPSPVFQVTISVIGDCQFFSHPLTDGDPNAILFVTPLGFPAAAFSLGYSVVLSRWSICNGSTLPTTFNVLVIKR